MKVHKTLLNATKMASVAFMAAGLILTPTAVLADSSPTYQPGTLIKDNFNTFYYRPDSRAFWYTENRGEVNGVETNSRETDCAIDTCVHLVTEGTGANSSTFMRLQQNVHNNSGFFTLANLSELEDGLGGSGNASGSWTPTVGNPVTVTAKLRFSSNMNLDGSGGAVGSAGLELWNNPYSPSVNSQGPGQNLIGFGWSYNGAALQGLIANVAYQTFPTYINPVSGINMSDWNVFKFVWSVDTNGVQSVTYYVNDQVIGSAQVPGFDHMSIEAWVDDQQFTFFGINDVPAPQANYMDIGYVTVKSGNND